MTTIPPVDVAALPIPAQKIARGEVPPKLREAAARGIAPGIRPADLLAVLVLLHEEGGETGVLADRTLGALPQAVLSGALSADLEPRVVDALATRYADKLEVVEALVRMPRVHDATLEALARAGGEPVTELLAVNEERLLRQPRLIELLYLNRRTRMSTAERLIELAARHELELTGLPAYREAVQAIQGELILEASEEPTPDDLLFTETDALAEALAAEDEEDTHEETDEGEEVLKQRFLPLYKRLGEMTISQKVRRAILGTKEERMLLIRERNKVIASAAVRSPLLQESEVALISRNRNISDEVLRIIGSTPEWLKSYVIKRNLVENSRTPVAIATRLIPHLRESDLRALAKSKNVSGAVQDAARRHLDRKK